MLNATGGAHKAHLETVNKHIKDTFGAMPVEFLDQLKADPELGGANLDATAAISAKGVAAYASPELKTLLEKTGLSKHKEVVRHFFKLGQGVKEDGMVGGGSNRPTEKQAHEIMYDGK